ncbi:unnamed protein product [Urochloa humidicola]
MGCTTSRQAQHDLRYCPSPLALPRSQSFPSRCPSDAGVHVVRLTSSTLGSLELDKAPPRAAPEPAAAAAAAARLAPRTPTMTPPNEPEDIDAWALMAGLEDHSPAPLLAAPFGRHSFSFPIAAAAPPLELAASAKVTPLPMPHATATAAGERKEKSAPPPPAMPRRRAVLYFTSLRGVRATYEDCCLARAILKGYGVRLDERDVSMHRGFRDELRGLLLGGGGGAVAKCWAAAAAAAGPALPSLFVDGELVGNAEELKRLHEAGELAARLDGCESAAAGDAGACEACGDVRFVLCETCSGSCKVYVDDESEQEDEDDAWDGEGGFRRCTVCNENGIVRCPVCC